MTDFNVQSFSQSYSQPQFELNFTLKLGKKSLSVDLQNNSKVVGLFGVSGSGKTSILHAVAGLLTPQTGKIRVGEQTWFDHDKRVNIPTQQRRVGLVFQDAQLFPHKTVRQNLLFGYGNIAPHERYVELEEIVDLLKIGDLLERSPAKLSGGEKQRVALGRALLYSPKLLLLDEPLSALDTPHKAEILPFFQQVARTLHVPMLYVSHDKSEIEQLTSVIYYV